MRVTKIDQHLIQLTQWGAVNAVTGQGLFASAYSNFGQELDCCAPGVRIISTTHHHPFAYGEMTGTSMATPVACACLANMLSEDPEYLKMQRNAERSDCAKNRILEACIDIGLPAQFQGRGLVYASKKLAQWSESRVT
jgi:serine protease